MKTSSKKRKPRPNVLINGMMAKLGELTVKEKFLKGEQVGLIVYGQCLGQHTIEINPVPALVDTIIHETLHALKPEWSENTVRQQTSRVFNRLTEAEMKQIYEIYKSKL